MATYAIGDIQGCFEAFVRLLACVDFDPDHDVLWLAGDLVNRGPANAEVLRWCLEHESRLRIVLGNHDLHLLACAEGLRRPKRRDTLQDVLNAPDRARLLDFLWRQPLLHREQDRVMTHAGIPPRWSMEDAQRRATRIAAGLQGPKRRDYLTSLYRADGGPGLKRDREALAGLTRMRTVDRDGAPVFEFAGPPSEIPRGQTAWFDWPGRVPLKETLIFGHWAALGLMIRPQLIALDSGCVWGHALTAYRLEDRRVFQVGFADGRKTR